VGSIVQAENLDMLSCGVGSVNIIIAGEDLTAMAVEGKGINPDNYGNRIFGLVPRLRDLKQ